METKHDVLAGKIWALFYACDGDSSCVQTFTNAEYALCLISILSESNSKILTHAHFTIINFVTGYIQQTQIIIGAGFLDDAEKLLKYNNMDIQK